MEAKIEELTGQVTALTEIITRQVAVQERLAAGAAAAMEKIEGGKAAATGGEGKATRTRRTAAAEPKADAPAPTESGEAAAEAASSEPEPKVVTFKDYAQNWLNAAEKGSDEYKRRGKHLMGILGNFGAGKISEVDEKNHAAAIFYIKRDEAGKPVDFSAAYDFAGDPAQDVEDDDVGGAFDD